MDNTILKNDTAAIRFRRDRSTLVILGVGVIVFGFWSIIKLAAYLIMDIPIYNVAEMDGFEEADLPLLMNTLYVVLSFDVIVRLIVGLNAISEARGKKNGRPESRPPKQQATTKERLVAGTGLEPVT